MAARQAFSYRLIGLEKIGDGTKEGTMAEQILSPEEIERYHRDGLLIPRYRLPESFIAEAAGVIRRLVEANPDRAPFVLTNVEEEGDGPTGISGSRRFLELAAYPPLLDMMEQLIGPDLLLWDCAVISKPPGAGKAIFWHQDSPYLTRIRPVATTTYWISIDGATPENGCMNYIPGSHTRGILRHEKREAELPGFEEKLDESQIDLSTARPVALEPGQFCIFDCHTVHGSTANRSTRPRTALLYRFIPGTVVYDNAITPYIGGDGVPLDSEERPVYLLRGQDRTGENKLWPLPKGFQPAA